MNLDQIDMLTSPEAKAKQKKKQDNQKQALVDLAQAYHRLFKTKDGERVLNDLTSKMIYGNDTPFASPNVNYEAAYKNGESGAIKYIINQITKAEVI